MAIGNVVFALAPLAGLLSIILPLVAIALAENSAGIITYWIAMAALTIVSVFIWILGALGRSSAYKKSDWDYWKYFYIPPVYMIVFSAVFWWRRKS